ncbi:conserved hypothetical protein [Desulfamplus magnetovallimortis]|uniref:HD Cas3-type domain-containing protein n=1 Tax=Desulfamplus magnetovallimortis TaxID=1246637 RepID=A0A1W1HHR3_9BACT|nr:type I-F CRISPR-associated helicase Cas3f [Desulfamplus magnetovallimortis]SLM32019.1 conserved hypothetical protein [Desulfamplus magnetovallimortis]
MNVLFVSQCSKRALTETRRILDQFAERKGTRTWQTAITLQGLSTLRKMLARTARRNTSVACHWIKAGYRTELLWIVGNLRRFNEVGTVPTNTTRRDVLKSMDENPWHIIEVIVIVSSIAGLFHDFGKTGAMFQKKVCKNARTAEPYRHEWLSVRLFQAFVGKLDDQQWLEKMSAIKEGDTQELLKSLQCDSLDNAADRNNPFKDIAPLAQLVCWLILSHHRMPKWPGNPGDEGAPGLQKIDTWLFRSFNSSWNSDRCLKKEFSIKEMQQLWNFNKGLPFKSSTWCHKASSLALRALNHKDVISDKQNWLQNPFVMHISRMCLMLADHIYSAQMPKEKWQEKKYKVFANTHRDTGNLKQKLDEHLIGVSNYAMIFSKFLPSLGRNLPSISRHRGFKKRSSNAHFRWQDKAYELACSIRNRTFEHGFFGVNMASTGCGKTFANGRIMYGLADENIGCRFNVALGLRTLTLQTGDALRKRLNLHEEDLGVLVGSQAARRLHGMESEEMENNGLSSVGSESSESLLGSDQYLRYEGATDRGPFSRWLQSTPQLHKLVSAPVLVSTIDYLTPATEGDRGGRQIGPMLRLLSSDLVLDEPDDFDISDLPALCRLVNWAGLLGSRVMISSATLPPALIKALFEAYLSGRREYQKGWGEPGKSVDICCGWFDEQNVFHENHGNVESFMNAHESFVEKRISHLKNAPPIRRGRLLPIDSDESAPLKVIEAIAKSLHKAQHKLHEEHGQENPETGKKISFGLVRMANINPLVAVARKIMRMEPKPGFHLHYCIYHGRHPLAVRSSMEKMLDSILDRHHPQSIWENPEIVKIISRYPETHDHIFVVLATAVAEVGRDHDYDWAIVEPSSMRSIIQLAGRIQRHRKIVPQSPNLLILSRNYKGLIDTTGKNPVFEKPGFETVDFGHKFKLCSPDLHDLVTEEEINVITSIPRIFQRSTLSPDGSLIDLEHAHLDAILSGDDTPGKAHASLWWKHNAHWCSELQRRTPFRESAPDIHYMLYFEDEGDKAVFYKFGERGAEEVCEKEFQRVELDLAQAVSLWGNHEPEDILIKLAESFDMDIPDACRQFGGVRLINRNTPWQYHPALGVYVEIE